ncbi:uncharacterized protein METZ01_LOCUS341681, partial [marine metagenome]
MSTTYNIEGFGRYLSLSYQQATHISSARLLLHTVPDEEYQLH